MRVELQPQPRLRDLVHMLDRDIPVTLPLAPAGLARDFEELTQHQRQAPARV